MARTEADPDGFDDAAAAPDDDEQLEALELEGHAGGRYLNVIRWIVV